MRPRRTLAWLAALVLAPLIGAAVAPAKTGADGAQERPAALRALDAVAAPTATAAGPQTALPDRHDATGLVPVAPITPAPRARPAPAAARSAAPARRTPPCPPARGPPPAVT
jgi:hypothetical protein